MKFKRIAKISAGLVLLAGLFTGVVLGAGQTDSTNTALAAKSNSSRVVKVSYKKTMKKSYHVKKGTFFTTSKLTKAKYKANRYKTTTFYSYTKGIVTRANGKKAVYYYVKSANGRIKGWIWHGYLVKGKAPSTSSKTPATITTTTTTTTTITTTNPTDTTKPSTNTNSQVPPTAQNQTNGSTTGPSVNTEKVMVQIFGPLPENKILASGDVDIKAGDTAFTVLQKLCAEKGVPVTYTGSDDSVYVTSIAGKVAGTGGVGGGWLYTVNSVFPDYSAGSYKVKNGDSVQWLWTTTMGDRGWRS